MTIYKTDHLIKGDRFKQLFFFAGALWIDSGWTMGMEEVKL